MEANLARPVCSEPRNPAAQPLAMDAAVLAANAAVGLLGLVVFGRRTVGSLQTPAPAGLLILTALLVSALSWLGRRLWQQGTRPGTARYQQADGLNLIVGWGPSVTVILLTFGLSWPGARWIDWLVWLPLWVADALWRIAFLAGEPLESAEAARPEDLAILHTPREAGGAIAHEADADLPDRVVLQRLTRLRDLQGRESIVGSLCAEMAHGQRTTELYVGFCPAFDRIPTIELEQSDGPPARVSVGQVLPHGARIDIRLSEPATDGDKVHVDLFAHDGAVHETS